MTCAWIVALLAVSSLDMEAIILSIGTELASGQTVDTNAAWLAGRLAAVGVVVRRHVTVSDDIEPIREELARACGEADVVLMTGGLGPTADDLTRAALTAVMGVPLARREECVGQIRSFFAARGREMPEANLVQADFPQGSEPIENTCGTAPGIKAVCGRATVFVMPGVPVEMEVMFERDVHPVLAARAGGAVLLMTTLHTYGAGESDIGQMIQDLMARGRNPTVGTTAKQGVIGVRVQAWGRSAEEAGAILDAAVNEICRRLGSLVFGRDQETLAHALGGLLRARGQTVVLAESCTGGLIACQMTDVPGSSAYFREGLVTYANEAKIQRLGVSADLIAEHGAVSASVAEAMAVGCRQSSGADYAISVTGIAGPEGGTPAKPVGLVYIGVADAAGCRVSEHRFGHFLSRIDIRQRAASTAINRLRLHLLSGGG